MYSNQAFLLPDSTPPPIPYPLSLKNKQQPKGEAQKTSYTPQMQNPKHKQKISETEMPNKAAEDQVSPPPPRKAKLRLV